MPARAWHGGAAPAAACNAPADLIRLVNPLRRVAQRLAGGQPMKIVAIGSSSTAGAGASSPAMTYPSRLEVELKPLFPRTTSRSQSRRQRRGSADMLARFETDVIAEKPDLVLWQVGTNSVLRDHALREQRRCARASAAASAAGADVVLIDPQYAPKVIAKPDADGMVELIAQTAKRNNVDLFQRFAMMRHWRLTRDMPFETFVSPDGLHMNDWSYGCIAKLAGRRDRGGGDAAPVGRPPTRRDLRPGAERLHTASSAVITSSIRSSGCSSPHDSRTKPSLMPSSARCSGVSR